MARKFGPLVLIFYKATKAAPTSLQIKFRVKPVETF